MQYMYVYRDFSKPHVNIWKLLGRTVLIQSNRDLVRVPFRFEGNDRKSRPNTSNWVSTHPNASKHVQARPNTSKHVQRCVQTRPIMDEAIVFNFAIECLVNSRTPNKCVRNVASLQYRLYVILCVMLIKWLGCEKLRSMGNYWEPLEQKRQCCTQMGILGIFPPKAL